MARNRPTNDAHHALIGSLTCKHLDSLCLCLCHLSRNNTGRPDQNYKHHQDHHTQGCLDHRMLTSLDDRMLTNLDQGAWVLLGHSMQDHPAPHNMGRPATHNMGRLDLSKDQ
jgi:hypothetical protein